MTLTCSWCGMIYEGNPLTHICYDGSDIHDRAKREIQYPPRKAKELPSAKVDYLQLTKYDVKFLKGNRVKIDDTDQLVD